MVESLAVLTVTTVTTAVFHTLIPDHWLPFVLVARSRRWTPRATAALTALSAVLHVSLSIALGLAAVLLGQGAEAVSGLGEAIETWSAAALVVFGVLYAAWFLFRGGHQHSFGMHPHHGPGVSHPPATPHPHDLAVEPSHHHDPGRSGLGLAVIVGFNPCALIIPYIYVAGTMGTAALVVVAAAFAVSTIACMVGVTLLGLKGTARLESPFLMRYGEAVSGGLIALTGLVVMLAGG